MRHRPAENTRGRREILGTALAGAAGGLLAAPSLHADERRPAVQRTPLNPPGAPAADSGYSPGILTDGGRLVFISGQGPEDYDVDMETQIRQTFARIELLLKEAGATFGNVVILRSYWVHLSRDLPIYRKVRKEFLIKPYPASTAVGTPELAIPGLELEIEALAVI